MKSIRLLDRRAGYSLASIGLLLGIVAPTVMPAFASADVITSRSITLSTAKPSATATYDVKFTAPGNISGSGSTDGGVVIGICSDSPLLGSACTAPAGFTFTGTSLTSVKYAGSAAAANGSVSVVDYSGGSDTNGLKWTANDDYTGGTTLELVLTGVTNPSDTGTFYARISTYADNTDLATWTDDDTLGTDQDEGAVALSTSSEIGVTAYVLESMTFCVSKGDVGNTSSLTANSTQAAPSEDCGTHEASSCSPVVDGCVVAPDMTLGQINGTVTALDATHVSTGGVYAQMSTNASGGAAVYLKSDALGCGGLYRNGVSDSTHCNIGPKNAVGGIAAGTANFGLTVGSAAAALTAAGAAGTGSGSISTNTGAGYGATDAFIEAATDNTTGVTSTYGSKLFSSTAPVNNMNVPVTFDATIGNTTPAGVYGAKFNMVATGIF